MTSSSSSNSVHPQWSWLRADPARLIAFGFGSGLAPIAPGTVGSLWAWAAGLIIFHGFNLTLIESLIGITIGFMVGIWACGKTGKDLGQPDHGGMVWDEVIAFWIILVFILPAPFWIQLLAFALFRVLDAAKPGPIKSIDLYFKSWKPVTVFTQKWELSIRGFGVMIDDLAAALGTLVLLAILYRLF